VEDELDLRRLTELQELLGSDVSEIVATLVREISAAMGAIESGLAESDLAAAALAAHAARNSALMLDARPMLDALREIEAGARDDDVEAARSGLQHLQTIWPSLRSRLEAAVERA
jgi:hypothetical protein